MTTLAAGLVCGFLAVVLSLSLGNLLFFGEMRDFVPVALGMALFTTAVVAAVAALTSPIPGVVSISEEVPIVAIAGPAAAITAAMSDLSPPGDIATTIVVAAALATLATGGVLLLLGYFRLGRLIRYVPFPVTGGFLAGTGWLILQGGISVIAGDAIGLGSAHILLEPGVAIKVAIGVGFAALIAIVQRRVEGALVLPACLLVALVAYNLVVVFLAIPAETLSGAGWTIPIRDSGLWPPIVPADIAAVDWGAIAASAVMLPGIVIVTVLALLMNATGIELASGSDVDLDKELRSVGLQNLAAGAGGGVPGYPAVSLSILAKRLGAANRLVGLVVAAVTLAVLLLGETILNLVPTPLLGSLLVWIGAALVYEWLVLTARRLAILEYLTIVLIFFVIVGVSFTTGVLVGLVAAVVLFVLEYGRVDSIRHVLTGEDYQSTFENSEERRQSLEQHGSAILIVRLQGFIFFGTSDRLRKRIEDRLTDGVRYLAIDFRRVTGVDSSAVVSFQRLSQTAARRGFRIVLSGMRPNVERSLIRGGLEPGPGLRVEADLDHGLMWCEQHLLETVAPGLDGERTFDLDELAMDIVKDEALAVELVRYFEPVALEPGELLVEVGAPSDEMYFIASGRGAIRIRGEAGGGSVQVATVGPGAIVGELAFYLARPRTASVVAQTSMTAWRFSRASLDLLRQKTPDLAYPFPRGHGGDARGPADQNEPAGELPRGLSAARSGAHRTVVPINQGERMPKFDAIFVGLTILDIAGRPVEAIPEGGNVAFIEEIRMNPAGTAAGAVMNAAKLGISTATVACLGKDSMGDLIIAEYGRMGIDCSMVQRSDTMRTSATILTIRPNGDRPALHSRGASDDLLVTPDQFDAVCDARFLHHGGTGLLKAMDAGPSAALLAHAKAKGLTTSFDILAPDGNTMGLLTDVLPHVDYFMPSMEEAAFLSGRTEPAEIAETFLAMGAGACIFKWGAKGSYVHTGAERFRVPGFRVRVSDTTGCGDSYCGGFVAGLAMGGASARRCELGTATSALVATGLGSDAGVVDLAQVEAFAASTPRLD